MQTLYPEAIRGTSILNWRIWSAWISEIDSRLIPGFMITFENDEVKKAYKKMAVKFHPDKVSHLGEEYQQDAKEKFQKVQQAYENIKKQRGIKW